MKCVKIYPVPRVFVSPLSNRTHIDWIDTYVPVCPTTGICICGALIRIKRVIDRMSVRRLLLEISAREHTDVRTWKSKRGGFGAKYKDLTAYGDLESEALENLNQLILLDKEDTYVEAVNLTKL